MSPILRKTLQAGMVRNLCSDRVEVHRFTLTEDGRGGATETWRKVAEYNARLINKSDSERIIGGGIQPTASWTLTVPVTADIMPHDRIYLVGDESRVYEVIGTDFGQTDLLIQHVGLQEYVG
jgi:head-tail adaptor